MHAHNPNSSPNALSHSQHSTHGVCGTLDPPGRSKKTKSGWRFIQLTDTPGELRVLLPPRPAAIYANLLKVEAYNLAKKSNDADTLREIQRCQYLKDVMIRRCQRLVQDTLQVVSASAGSRPISVFEAPIDFKVNRLEQWWEEMEPQVKMKSRSSRSQRQAHAERQNRMQNSTSTTTLSPNKIHAHNDSQVNVAQGTVLAQFQRPGETQTSPSTHRKRPTPLTVPAPGYAASAQSSPSVIPRSPSHSVRPSSIQVSPQVPQQRPAVAQVPVYSNAPVASALESPYNPSFDPNQSLPAHQTHSTPAVTHLGIPTSAHSPNMPVMTSTVNDPRLDKHLYGSTEALAETVPQVDPSYLKNRFQATYMLSPDNSNSSPSSNDSKPPGHSPQIPTGRRDKAGGYIYAGPGHTTHPRAHGSLSTPLPNSANTFRFEIDHRRRATVDCEDTDRSVPRPKGYMYREAPDATPGLHYSDNAYGAQGVQKHDGDRSPSVVRQVTRMLNHGLVAGAGGSPHSSTGSQGSPRLRSSPAASYILENSPRSQNSPGKGAQARGYTSNLAVDQVYTHSNGGSTNGSPNLLPPDPVISRSQRGHSEYEAHASRQVSPLQADGARTVRQLRRTGSRRDLHDANRETAAGEPVVPPAEYYAPQTRSPRRSPVPSPSTQQPVEPEYYQRGRTRRGESSPRRRYDASPGRGEAVIPNVTAFTPSVSNRNSRYTSGESSVSEPVIPDVSLIIEAEVSRNKGDRIRRRLVPFQSSSEEGGSRHPSEFESSYSSSDDEGDFRQGGGGYYRRPYRVRDGYGSGYEGEDARPRAPSRPASRSPSRGILKRSSSVCSQRSTKSVRLEIPRDRRALEEVRDAEDKADRAQKHLDDLRGRKGSRTKTSDAEIAKATEALDEAKRSLKQKEDEYQSILAAMKGKRPEAEPHYV